MTILSYIVNAYILYCPYISLEIRKQYDIKTLKVKFTIKVNLNSELWQKKLNLSKTKEGNSLFQIDIKIRRFRRIPKRAPLNLELKKKYFICFTRWKKMWIFKCLDGSNAWARFKRSQNFDHSNVIQSHNSIWFGFKIKLDAYQIILCTITSPQKLKSKILNYFAYLFIQKSMRTTSVMQPKIN